MSKKKRLYAFVLVLGLLAILGAWLLKISTPFGLGLIDDSISYVAAGRALLAGKGFTRIWLASGEKPITHWPPLYSALLAFSGFVLGIDPYRGARAAGILIYGINAALLGWLGWRMTRSYWVGVFLALLFLSNGVLLSVNAYALSEPLYMTFTLLVFLSFARYLENERVFWLILAGFLTGFAYLTRYVALSVLATLFLAIFILRPTWKKRFFALFIFLLSAFLPISAWMIRNKLLSGRTTNRVMAWHPVTEENLRRGINETTHFLIPIESWWERLHEIPYLFEGILLLILAVLSLWVVKKSFRSFFQPASEDIEPLSLLVGIYILGYLGSLLFSLSFFDGSTPLNNRILSPFYLSLLILLPAVGTWLWRTEKRFLRIMLVFMAIFLLTFSTLNQIKTIHTLREDAQGFASWRWRKNAVMGAIHELPEEMPVYTNQPPAVYFWTDHPAFILPGSDEEILQIRGKIAQGSACFAFFPHNRGEYKEGQMAILINGLSIIEETYLDTLYGIRP